MSILLKRKCLTTLSLGGDCWELTLPVETNTVGRKFMLLELMLLIKVYAVRVNTARSKIILLVGVNAVK